MADHLRDATKKVDYISRDYAVENMENYPWDTEHDKNAAIHLVRELVPAADVRPVVLCKDCRHRDPEDNKCDCGQLERAGCVFPVDDNYWCAHGEKGGTNAKD